MVDLLFVLVVFVFILVEYVVKDVVKGFGKFVKIFVVWVFGVVYVEEENAFDF